MKEEWKKYNVSGSEDGGGNNRRPLEKASLERSAGLLTL